LAIDYWSLVIGYWLLVAGFGGIVFYITGNRETKSADTSLFFIRNTLLISM